ncbi:hypothetical protein Leryth_021287 [Lithospermum erythrorhizon]|nr:hypothetical protein Leryth_021287 [Lithospermum erythrorhizon]
MLVSAGNHYLEFKCFITGQTLNYPNIKGEGDGELGLLTEREESDLSFLWRRIKFREFKEHEENGWIKTCKMFDELPHKDSIYLNSVIN